jgi:hypothetical protein
MKTKQISRKTESKNWLSPVIKYLKDHIKADFNPIYYGFTTIFLAITITINYMYDFENSVIDSYRGQSIRILWYFLLYSAAYFPVLIVYAWTNKKFEIFRSTKFWIMIFVGLLTIALDGAFHYHRLLTDYMPIQLHYLYIKITWNLKSIITVLLPLWLIYKYYDKPDTFYGLTTKNVDFKPYALMLLIMLPLITAASFQEDFIRYYPTFKPNSANEYLGVPPWVTMLAYELVYGWDFVATELSFRGFLIIGLAGILGRGTILPMVAAYAFLHFGKPLGETLGSIFGGYILGVLALYSRNIWGGIAIHLGVAWLMEFTAWLQHVFRSEI